MIRSNNGNNVNVKMFSDDTPSQIKEGEKESTTTKLAREVLKEAEIQIDYPRLEAFIKSPSRNMGVYMISYECLGETMYMVISNTEQHYTIVQDTAEYSVARNSLLGWSS